MVRVAPLLLAAPGRVQVSCVGYCFLLPYVLYSGVCVQDKAADALQ
jgi:hypothetical protein